MKISKSKWSNIFALNKLASSLKKTNDGRDPKVVKA